jgi:hypothetical protein
MKSIYRKYSSNSINDESIHKSYHATIESNVHFNSFMIAMIPVIRYNYKKIYNPTLTIDEFEDVCNDVFEQCLKTMSNKIVFEDKNQTMVYVSAIVETVILKKIKYYNNISNMDLCGLENNLIASSFSSTQVLLKIHAKEMLELLVNSFTNSIRFIGQERNVCLIIFDSMMKEEDINKKYLSMKYNLDAEFYVNYVSVMIKKILYKFKDIKLNDITDIIHEGRVQYNWRKSQNQTNVIGSS